MDVCLQVCKDVRTYVRGYICMYAHIQHVYSIYIYTYLYPYIYMYMYYNTCMYNIYACMILVYIYICIHINIHTCIWTNMECTHAQSADIDCSFRSSHCCFSCEGNYAQARVRYLWALSNPRYCTLLHVLFLKSAQGGMSLPIWDCSATCFDVRRTVLTWLALHVHRPHDECRNLNSTRQVLTHATCCKDPTLKWQT